MKMTSGSGRQGSTSGAFRVGEWLVEPTLNRISKDGRCEHLEPKAVEVLVCLAERSGEVVSRRELVDRVWATEFIADSNLSRAVAMLRKVFGDSPRQPRFIETIPKRGYRLVEPVEWLDTPTADRAASTTAGAHPPTARITANGVVTLLAPPSLQPLCSLFSLGDEIPLEAGEYMVGRDVNASILVVSSETSRCHSRLSVGPLKVTIEDAGSKNGTIVNGRLISRSIPLEDGDEIDVGSVVLVFRAPLGLTTRTRSAMQPDEHD